MVVDSWPSRMNVGHVGNHSPPEFCDFFVPALLSSDEYVSVLSSNIFCC
jgi:hypothetical protein